ncbi:MAG TPA: SDR family oxidoreductase [Gemmatimonadales bacterium]|jgi:nucleoside-diphosphate-sugar epimerase|nr:SDR family oxidoreductase [Gemmatimonadales bacterium]
MRFLVTGGAGFIGSHIVARLVEGGEAVVVLDDLSTGHREYLRAVRDRIRFIRGSVTSLEVCRRAMQGVDIVLHEAAVTSVPLATRDPVTAHHVNVTGTVNVLVAAREAGVQRVVYAGSTSAYGDAAELPNHEALLPRPLSEYAASKLAGEAYCQAFYRTHGLETVVLRYFNIFGPRQDPASQYGAVIPRFIAAALAGTPPVIFGDGGQTRDFTYVANVVHANLLAARAPAAQAAGAVFNIGSGVALSVAALWERIRAAAGVDVEPVYEAARPGDVRDSLASIEEARAALGYEPIVDFDAGLARTVAWYRAGAARPRPARAFRAA